MFPLTGSVEFNGGGGKIELNTIRSEQGMDEAISSRLGTQEMTQITVAYLAGIGKKAKRMANMVL